MGKEDLARLLMEAMFNVGAILSDEEHQPGIASARQSMENLMMAKELKKQKEMEEEQKKWKKFKKIGGIVGGIAGGALGGLGGALGGAALPRAFANVKMGLSPWENLADVLVGGAIDFATGQLFKGLLGGLFKPGTTTAISQPASQAASQPVSQAVSKPVSEAVGGAGGSSLTGALMAEPQPIKLNPLLDSPSAADRLLGKVQEFGNYFENLGRSIATGGLANQNPFPSGSAPHSLQDLLSTLTSFGQTVSNLAAIGETLTGSEDSDLSSTVAPTTASGFIPYGAMFALNEERRRRAELAQQRELGLQELAIKRKQAEELAKQAEFERQFNIVKTVAELKKAAADKEIDVMTKLMELEETKEAQKRGEAFELKKIDILHEQKLEEIAAQGEINKAVAQIYASASANNTIGGSSSVLTLSRDKHREEFEKIFSTNKALTYDEALAMFQHGILSGMTPQAAATIVLPRVDPNMDKNQRDKLVKYINFALKQQDMIFNPTDDLLRMLAPITDTGTTATSKFEPLKIVDLEGNDISKQPPVGKLLPDGLALKPGYTMPIKRSNTAARSMSDIIQEAQTSPYGFSVPRYEPRQEREQREKEALQRMLQNKTPEEQEQILRELAGANRVYTNDPLLGE